MTQFIKEEGTYPVVITAIEIIQGRWDDKPDDMEVKVTGETADGLVGSAYSALTMEYVQGGGKNAGKQRYAVTMDMLQELGLPGQDLSQLHTLVGTAISFFGKNSSGGHLNLYINTRTENVISAQDAAAKLNAMFGGGQQQVQQQAPVQQQQQVQQVQQQPQQGQIGQVQQGQVQQPQQGQLPGQDMSQQGQFGTNPFPTA